MMNIDHQFIKPLSLELFRRQCKCRKDVLIPVLIVINHIIRASNRICKSFFANDECYYEFYDEFMYHVYVPSCATKYSANLFFCLKSICKFGFYFNLTSKCIHIHKTDIFGFDH